ncbi:MAG: Rid family hydrolase [Pseudomonadota bacterium]
MIQSSSTYWLQARALFGVVLAASALIQLAPVASAQGVHEVIVPEPAKRNYDELHFAPAVRAGDFLFLSGVVAGAPPGVEMTEEEAYDRAFRAIQYFLEQAGAGWEHVVEIETFHVDLPAGIQTFSAVKDKYIKKPYPAWTAIDIDRLYPDNAYAEIKVVAYLAAPRTLKD